MNRLIEWVKNLDRDYWRRLLLTCNVFLMFIARVTTTELLIVLLLLKASYLGHG